MAALTEYIRATGCRSGVCRGGEREVRGEGNLSAINTGFFYSGRQTELKG